MKVWGLSSSRLWRPIRPSLTRPRNFFCHGPKPWTAAMASAAMKPTLWRWSAYCAPGLPRPAQICMGAVTASKNAHPASGMGVLVRIGSRRSLGFLAAFGFAAGFTLGFFLADGRNLALRRGFLFLGLLHRRRGNDGSNGEVAIVDRRFHALGQLDLADVERIADLEPGEIDVDLVGDLCGVASQLQLV